MAVLSVASSMTKFRKQITSLVLPLFVLILFVGGGSMWLRNYTRHGELMRVPDLQGLSVEEAAEMLANRRLYPVVIDSIHTEDVPKGSIVDQDPDAGSEVKPERKVYVVLNAMQPKMIDMPDLVDLSKRQAMSVLEIIGLKVKELEYRPDPCTDCVIEVRYKGQPIEADERIRSGEAITLVLGSGDKGERVLIPDLRGLTFAETGTVLNMASLNQGVVVECLGCNTRADSALARVRRQSPSADGRTRIHLGSMIDIWLTSDTSGLRPREGWNNPANYQEQDTLDATD